MKDAICQNCEHYSVKGESGDGKPEHEIGKCCSEVFHEQVIMTGRGLLERLHLDKRDIVAAMQLRVRGDFGCKHWKEYTEDDTE